MIPHAKQILSANIIKAFAPYRAASYFDSIVCSLNNKKNQDLYSLYQGYRSFNNDDSAVSMSHFETILNSHLKKNKLKKVLKEGTSVYSLQKNIYKIYKSNPRFIYKHFNPLPPIDDLSYLYFLFSKKVNVYKIYPYEMHGLIEKEQDNVQIILDKYQLYFDFELYKENSVEIQKENSYLFSLLEEKRKVWEYKEIQVKSEIMKEFDVIGRFEGKSYEEIFKFK